MGAVDSACESVQDGFAPTPIGGWGKLENYATTGTEATGVASGVGGAIDVSLGVENHGTFRRASVGSAGEAVEHSFRPATSGSWRHPIDVSAYAARRSAVPSRAVKIAGSVEDDSGEGIRTVAYASEGVEHGFGPAAAGVWRQCKTVPQPLGPQTIPLPPILVVP